MWYNQNIYGGEGWAWALRRWCCWAWALLACYWLLTAAWLYRSAVNEGMNKSLWIILALVCNLLAVAAFLIVRDAPQRTRKAV